MNKRALSEAVEVAVPLESQQFDCLRPHLDQLRCFSRLGIAVGLVEPAALRRFPGLLPTGPLVPLALPNPPDPVRDVVPWNLEYLQIERCWDQGITGEGVVVGHLDTGIDGQHPALRDRVAGFRYFDLDGYPVDEMPVTDANGHGTHTAGTICGGVVDHVAIGVAPGARLCSGVVIEGGKSLVRVLCGLDWLLDCEIRVVNMALGTATYNPIFEVVLVRLRTQGVLPVMPVGNRGPGRTTSPGNYPMVLSAGAIDRDNQPARFSGSSTGKPDVVAPGVDVVSAQAGGGLATRCGTSMAAAHVAGVAALLFQVRPDAPIEIVEQAIIEAAQPLPHARQIYPEKTVTLFPTASSLKEGEQKQVFRDPMRHYSPGICQPHLVDPVAAIERLRHATW
jgi:subtilisin